MIFSFGARRSGTWWLQRLITAHPRVAPVPSETFFFSNGIAPLFERFQHEKRGAQFTGRVYADRELLLDATRDFCDRIFAQFLRGKADRVAERTPWNVRHLDLLTDIYPDAYYVHIYRDGRDAIRSLATRKWFEGTLEDAAVEWRDSVMAPRESRRPERYIEVRYEDLLTDPRTKIVELYEFLGLKAKPDVVERAMTEARREVNTDTTTGVAKEKWRELLTPEEQATIMSIAGDALVAYGYLDPAELNGAGPAARQATDGLLGDRAPTSTA
jgi:hypothetical protein